MGRPACPIQPVVGELTAGGSTDTAPGLPGRVLAHFGARCLVETDEPGSKPIECTLPRRLKPVCGDLVWYEKVRGGGHRLVEIRERRNSFPRVDRQGRPRVIAANLDRVLVVLAPEPAPTRYIVDRYLVAAHAVGVPPMLVANKSDLDSHGELMKRLAPYADIGYALLPVSTKTGKGLDRLRRELEDRTAILAGQSGVGKSRLAACLLPEHDIASRELSSATGKGRHTTTAARLYPIPGGGELVDTPGVWEYGLWEMPQAAIEQGFVEFRPHLGKCKFRNCRHAGEPGCAVENAVRCGEISERRVTAFRQILDEMGTNPG